MINVIPVVLCGGSGSRLWPLSRSGFPKQFLCLAGNESLFQQATARVRGASSETITVANPVVVTAEDHRFLVTEQLREAGLPLGLAILEPVARNTAAALTLAALAAQDAGDDPVLLVTPADQSVNDAAAYTRALQHAIVEANTGAVVILGVKPDRPETGYGYIQANDAGQDNVLHVKGFVEKPDLATAQRYLADGGYFWNAGIFVLKASVWLAALGQFRPDILQATTQAWQGRSIETLASGAFARPCPDAFEKTPSESVDYAVLEKCPQSPFVIKMVSLNAGWSDLGAWDAVWAALPKDNDGNAQSGDVLLSNVCNSLVHASSRLVAVVGVDNLVVVETPDAVLVAGKQASQGVKLVVESLLQANRTERAAHRKVHRPWGWYDSIDEGDRFKVKRIMVKPKASLSLQKHHHRAEHWVVVKGTAEIRRADQTITLTENQSAYIPLGELHRLTNPGSIDLEIIEVQSGSYLGEDDIVRYEDSYGRAPGVHGSK